jgi:hypothetical protein
MAKFLKPGDTCIEVGIKNRFLWKWFDITDGTGYKIDAWAAKPKDPLAW